MNSRIFRTSGQEQKHSRWWRNQATLFRKFLFRVFSWPLPSTSFSTTTHNNSPFDATLSKCMYSNCKWFDNWNDLCLYCNRIYLDTGFFATFCMNTFIWSKYLTLENATYSPPHVDTYLGVHVWMADLSLTDWVFIMLYFPENGQLLCWNLLLKKTTFL